MPENTIDRSKLKDPCEVSGWGCDRLGRSKQDWSDIARPSAVKPEFERGQASRRGRGDARREDA